MLISWTSPKYLAELRGPKARVQPDSPQPENAYGESERLGLQLDLRLHHFSQIPLNVKKKKKNKKLAGLWLAGEVVNHVGIYGSKVAEGLSAFQRRSCFWL